MKCFRTFRCATRTTAHFEGWQRTFDVYVCVESRTQTLHKYVNANQFAIENQSRNDRVLVCVEHNSLYLIKRQ